MMITVISIHKLVSKMLKTFWILKQHFSFLLSISVLFLLILFFNWTEIRDELLIIQILGRENWVIYLRECNQSRGNIYLRPNSDWVEANWTHLESALIMKVCINYISNCFPQFTPSIGGWFMHVLYTVPA